MGKTIFDIQPFFSKLVNTKEYSSGTLYKAFDIIPRSDVNVHNASWDCLSLFLSLKKVISIMRNQDKVYNETTSQDNTM